MYVKIERKNVIDAMIVSGHNFLKVLCAESNNDKVKNPPAISPPVQSILDIPSLLSYSVYDEHAILVTRDGRGFVIGNGVKGKICLNQSITTFKHLTQLTIQDNDSNECVFLSAVCGTWYTLYLLQSHPTDKEFKIAFSYYNTPNETPLFINTGERNPISLYGGHTTAAVICSDGSVIILNEGIFHTPNEVPPILILPKGEKAISVACMEELFIVLSENGKLYKYIIPAEMPSYPLVTEIDELKGVHIVQLSGTAGHCLAVADDGRVFGRGINESGRIGISGHSKISTFSEITELKEYKIRVALAGAYHSLFLTTKGRVLACGVNFDGELLLPSGPSNEDVLTPVKTSVHHGATFGITGIFVSALFVDCKPPPNMANYINKGKLPVLPNTECEVKLPSDVVLVDDLSQSTNNLVLSKLRSHPVINNGLLDNSGESDVIIQLSPRNSAKNSGQISSQNGGKNSGQISAQNSGKNSSVGNHEEDVVDNIVNKDINSSGSQSVAFQSSEREDVPIVASKSSKNQPTKSPLKTDSKTERLTQSSPKSSKSKTQSPKETTKSRSTPKSTRTNQESSEMRSLSSTSIPHNTNTNNAETSSKKRPPPASKLSVSTNNDTKNPITSESRLSMSTNYGEYSEVAGLRQQIKEMKELLDSKDKEIQRLTRLNNALLDNDKDLQNNLEECWDNQQNKIEEHDMYLSKRRKDD